MDAREEKVYAQTSSATSNLMVLCTVGTICASTLGCSGDIYTTDPEHARGYSLLEIDAYVYIVFTPI